MSPISVIVPVYNVEKYLQRCVDSILAQTFTDYELILVDDGSPDRSGEICDEYAERDNRVRVIHQKNSGVSAARNNGVEVALGEYITFIDSDDWVHCEYLERLYNAILETGADIAVTHVKTVRDGETATVAFEDGYVQFSGKEAIQNYENYKEESGSFVEIDGPVCKLTKVSIVKKHPFPLNRQFSEDAATVYHWYWEADKVVDIKDTLYFYFFNENSLTNTIASHKIGRYHTYMEKIQFYGDVGLTNLRDRYISKLFTMAIKEYSVSANYPEYKSELYKLLSMVSQKYFFSDRVILDYSTFFAVYRTKRVFSIREAVECLIHSILSNSYLKDIMPEEKNRQISLLRKLLLCYGSQCRISCEQYAYAYELAFPKIMPIYWIVKAQMNKIKRRKRL